MNDRSQLSDDVGVGVGVGGDEVGEVVGAVVVVVVHFGDVVAGGLVEALVKGVAEDGLFWDREDVYWVGELVGEVLDVVDVEVVAVEDEDEFFVGPVLGGDVVEGVFDVVRSFGGEEDADFGCGVGGDVELGEELFESVFAGVVGEDVASGGDGVAFSGWQVLEVFEVGFEFLWGGGGELLAVE